MAVDTYEIWTYVDSPGSQDTKFRDTDRVTIVAGMIYQVSINYAMALYPKLLIYRRQKPTP